MPVTAEEYKLYVVLAEVVSVRIWQNEVVPRLFRPHILRAVFYVLGRNPRAFLMPKPKKEG